MKTQFMALLFLFVLNVASFIVMTAQTSNGEPIVPGVKYATGLNATANIEQIEEQFNGTALVAEWTTPPDVGIPLFGDIYYVTIAFAKNMRFLFDGFAMTFDWMGGFIPTTGGQVILGYMALIIRAVGAIMVGTLIFEIISGRRLLP